MNPNRWADVERVYHAAAARPVGERAAFLVEACAGDDALRREVESLLAQPASAGGFLDGPAMAVAAQMGTDAGASVLSGDRLGAIAIGSRLSHYTISGPLGAGGMGVVYRAIDARLNRTVALKVIAQDLVADPERKQRFVREARAASSLSHPNIVTIHDIGEADGVDFIVMELVSGQSLERLIHEERRGRPGDSASG